MALSDEDKEVIDPESVRQFEAQAEGEEPNPEPSEPSGEEEDEEIPPAEPEKRTVTVGGRTLEVTPDVAEAIEAQQAEMARQVERTREEIRAEMSPPSEPSNVSDEDLSEQFWTDPANAVQKIVDKKVSEARQEFEAEQKRTQHQQKFWNDFYSRHPELKEDSDIVEMILDRDYSALKDMEIESAQDELAKRAAKRIGKTLTSGGSGGKKRTTTASGSPTSGRQQAPKKEAEPAEQRKSLSQVLRERRQSRDEPSRKAG